MKKILVYGAGAAAAAAAVAATVLYFKLGAIVKAAVETFGPKITQTEVRLARVSVSPLSGKGQLRGLLIGNPKGFRAESAFKLSSVRIALDLGSLRTDKVVVREIVVDGPVITFEGSLSGSNIGRLQKNVEAFAPPSGGSGPRKELKVEIGRFLVKNGRVNLSLSGLGSHSMTIPLPEVELRDIGKKSDGATVKEAAGQIFSALTSAVLKTVSGSGALLKDATKAAADAAGKDVSKLKGLFKK